MPNHDTDLLNDVSMTYQMSEAFLTDEIKESLPNMYDDHPMLTKILAQARAGKAFHKLLYYRAPVVVGDFAFPPNLT